MMTQYSEAYIGGRAEMSLGRKVILSMKIFLCLPDTAVYHACINIKCYGSLYTYTNQ